MDTVPQKCIPITVIEATTYLIRLREIGHTTVRQPKEDTYYEKKQLSVQTQVIGKYNIEEQILQELYNKWHTSDSQIIWVIDGGLKDQVGTSSYAMFFPLRIQPIISGYAVEYQPRVDASSTRQELLGQLGIKYWLSKLENRWGKPRNGVKIALITDSQASIDIMENMPNITGIKDTLRPEMDVAMELYQQRLSHNWCPVECLQSGKSYRGNRGTR